MPVDGKGKGNRLPGKIPRQKIGGLPGKRAFFPGRRMPAPYLSCKFLPVLTVKGKENLEESLITRDHPAEPKIGLK